VRLSSVTDFRRLVYAISCTSETAALLYHCHTAVGVVHKLYSRHTQCEFLLGRPHVCTSCMNKYISDIYTACSYDRTKKMYVHWLLGYSKSDTSMTTWHYNIITLKCVRWNLHLAQYSHESSSLFFIAPMYVIIQCFNNLCHNQLCTIFSITVKFGCPFVQEFSVLWHGVTITACCRNPED
jgi:hypothetical protein